MLKNISKRLIVICSWLIALALWGLLHAAKFNFSAFNLDTCTLRMFFGISCIACGGTRATDNLIHLDFVNAFLYNPLYVILLAIFFVYAIIISIDVLLHGAKTITLNKKAVKFLVVLLIIICILFSIIRNTPIYLQYFYF